MSIGDAKLQADMERDAQERAHGNAWVVLGEVLADLDSALGRLKSHGERSKVEQRVIDDMRETVLAVRGACFLGRGEVKR